MRLLVDCTPLSSGGGVQNAVAFLTNLQSRPEIVWQAVVPTKMRPMLPDGLMRHDQIVWFNKEGHLDRLRIRYSVSAIETTFAPDVVFTISGPSYFRARAPHAVGFALPNLVYEPQGPLLPLTLRRRAGDFMKRMALRQADHYLVQTKVIAHRLAALLKLDASRISIVENSVNPVLAQFPLRDAPTGPKFGILVPSVYYRHKNLEIIPAVAAAMRRRDPRLDFEFRLTLNTHSEPFQAIKTSAHGLGVGEQVMAIGEQRLDKLAFSYNDASAVFLPTLREASTAVYPESFHFGRPLLTTDMDFAKELCGQAAIFVSPFDAEGFAEKLVELARNPALRQRLVDAGRAQLRARYPTAEQKFEKQIAVLAMLARFGLKRRQAVHE